MSADDQQHLHPDPDSSSELDMQFNQGNRPASGARRATPGEVLATGFQGAQNAGDFLGLDTEFTASNDSSGAQEGAADSDLSMVAPPTTMHEVDEGEGAVATEHGPDHQGSEGIGSESASAFQYGQDLGEEHEDLGDGFDIESEPQSAKRPILAALLVAVLGFGTVFFGSDLVSYFKGEAEGTVARAPAPGSKGTEGAPTVSSGSEDPAAAATGSESAVVSESTVVPTSEVTTPTTSSAPVAPVVGSSTSTTGARPSTGSQATPTPTPDSSLVEDVPGSEGIAALLPPSVPEATGFPELSAADYAWASEDQLELIWRGQSIPLEAIRAPAKTMMPRVGDVRVFTDNGAVHEGRLYAVGQNRVWIDTEPGRVGLDGTHVERIEAITASAQSGDGHATPGHRVGVRVPGGLLFGNVLKIDGQEVMIALDDGGKVRVKASDLEELGSGRAVVVGR